MVFNWFKKDVFVEFYRRIKRLDKFVKISEGELQIEHFVELRRHFKKISDLFAIALEYYIKELDAMKSAPESEYKIELKKLSLKLREELEELRQLIGNGLLKIEEILKIRVISKVDTQKEELINIILYIKSNLNKVEKNAIRLVVIEKELKKHTKKAYKKPFARIIIVGKLNNGWPLKDIRDVIIDLGGVVVENPGSRKHPYKINFPGYRKIPLGKSTPPNLLITQISKITGIGNQILRNSFSQGKLLAA